MPLINLNNKYKNKQINKKSQKRLLVVFLILFLALTIPSLFIFLGFRQVISHGKLVISAYKEQNFEDLTKEVSKTKFGLWQTDLSLGALFWLRLIPFIGGYYADAKGFSKAGVEELTALEILLKELKPYKDELQFDRHEKKGPDRITQIVKTLDKSLPVLDKIENNLKSASKSVENINLDKYPEKIKGKNIRKNLSVAKNFIIGAAIAVKEGRQALAIAPKALGVPSEKDYLLLFQNDKEIRATVGFMTAFATLTLKNGQINATTSDDIYRLDEKLLKVCLTKICPLAPPAPIIKYLPEFSGKPRTAWSMRDSNLSPDLPTSAKEFEKMYQFLGEGLPFDGIIYIDTIVVEKLIEITGPIDVYGTIFSHELDKRCNCPNVIYELESYAEIAAEGEKDRKAILGVLMQQILARSIGSDIEKIPQLVEVIATLANHKHVMFYMHDQQMQQALSNLNWIGEIKEFDGDYLHINDSNFAGGKSNIYVDQTVTQEINIKDNKITKKVIVEYKNPEQFNTWLNGINRDYVRFYVPKGSKLISSKGSEEKVTTIEDLDKTVFEAFIQVRPQNSRKLEVEYELPYQPKDKYNLLIQKQPGAKDFRYKVKINGSQKVDINLETDKEFKFDI